MAQIFWLKSHKPSVYNRKQIVAVGGDENAPPIAVAAQAQPAGVQIYLPANGRGDNVPTMPVPPRVIDVEIEGTAEPVTDENRTKDEQRIKVKLR